MAGRLPKEVFQENLNTEFRVHFEPDITIKLELFEVNEGPSAPQQEQFSLMFRGPLEPAFRQATCRIQHDRLGELTLFLVPMARKPEGMIYEAVFNRFIKPSEEAGDA
jgi:hypothetical protein